MKIHARAVDVLGVDVHAVTMADAIDIVDRAIAEREQLQIGVVNAAKVVNMQRNPVLRDAVGSSDLILADGMAIVWASRILGRPLPERVTGIDLMMAMFQLANRRGYSVFLLGATDDVSRAVAERVAAEFPGAVVAGRRNGYFEENEEEQVASEIRNARPDILLVAMTSPKKEDFLARWSAWMDVPVCHGVGGSFDVYSGAVERAPLVLQRLGLEWLYRVGQEPRRLWRRYLVTNTLFCGLLVRELWRQWVPSSRAVGKRA